METDGIYENFDGLFRSKIVPKLTPLESKRKKLLKTHINLKRASKILKFTFLFFAIALLIIYLCAINNPAKTDDWILLGMLLFHAGFAFVPLSLLVAYALDLIAEGHEAVFAFELKNEILPLIFSPIGSFKIEKKPTNVYEAELADNLFCVQSEMNCAGVVFPVDIFYTDDVIKGRFDNKNVVIAEGKLKPLAGLEYKQILMIKVTLNKNIEGRTVLKHRYSKNYIDHDGLERITLEDVDIIKKYDIYSNSQVESRRFLEPNLIKKINEVKKRIYAHSIDFVTSDNILYIIINSNHNYFEIGSLYKSLCDEWKFKNALKEVCSIIKLVNYFEFV